MIKKIIALYVSIFIVCLSLPFLFSLDFIRGDVNKDGEITIVDALLVAQFLGGLDPGTFDPDLADINLNGEVDDEDALFLTQYVLKLLPDIQDIETSLSIINLVPNPGFEKGTEGWINFGDACTLTASKKKAYAGEYSGYCTGRTDTWNGPGLDIRHIMEEGRTYHLSVYAILENPGSVDLQATIKKSDDSGDEYTPVGSVKVTHTEWRKISGSYTLEMKGTIKELVLYIENAPAGVSYYVDNAVIIDTAGERRPLDTPTPVKTPDYTPTPLPSPTPLLTGNERTYVNPILPGFYPDPSICRAGDNYYLVCSSFSYYPGLPIFQSKDLVNWRQIGHVLDRPSQLNLDNLPLSSGIFAPTIHYHKGTFYIANMLVGRGNSFIVTAQDPAGPWSDPFWIKRVQGIDPSLFFDDDGKVYWVSNGNPGSPRYSGHKVIWIQEFNLDTMEVVPDTKHILVDGGSNPFENPIWIEAPHIYKTNGYYYLMAAEGGTAEDHSEVIFRSRSVTGPYENFAGNPILTQRHLPADRPYPVTCAGHADMVETQNGEWWTVFLACRPYEPYQQNYYNMGRETFMAPVEWIDGWPIINPEFELVQYSYLAPDLPEHMWQNTFPTGNFTIKDNFDKKELAGYWIMLRTPREEWYNLTEKKGYIRMKVRPEEITLLENPSFIGRRQQHHNFIADTALLFTPETENETAGITAFQNETHFYYAGLTRSKGKEVIRLEKGVEEGAGSTGTSREVKEDVKAEKDQFLYMSERYGNIEYSIPVPADQTYTITFKMAELFQKGPGKRLFNIYIEEKKVVSELDLFREAGGAFKAYDMTFSAHTLDDSLDISFETIADNASVCALLVQDDQGRIAAAMNCGGSVYTAEDGIRYVLDRIYLSKKSVSKDKKMTLSEIPLPGRDARKPLYLRVKGAGKEISFYYSEDNKTWKAIQENLESSYLSTKKAGGFVGVVIGLYTSSQGTQSDNFAYFDWYEYTGNDPVYKTIK